MTRLRALTVTLLLLLMLPGSALAVFDQMPSQEWMDNAPPDSTMSGGTWSDMDGGAAVRPYIKSLSVVNGSESTLVFSGGAGAAAAVAPGDVTATISPINLCKRGQAPAPGSCYATPNRIGVVFGYRTPEGIGTDFSRPRVALRQRVDANTTFDVVVGLNSLGQTLRWTWINGDFLDWKTAGLGTPGGEVRLRIKPAVTPDIDWSQTRGGGCTATPIFDCDIPRANGAFLGASMVLSIDDTLDPSLTGAAFATQGAIAGFLLPSGTASAPALDLQMASAHLAADGTLQRGTLKAFLPARALLGRYGVLPADAASFFTATRRGDPGTQGTPQFQARAADERNDAGLFVTVPDVTFSAPTYRLARKRSTVRFSASSAAQGRIRMATPPLAACRRGACRLLIFRTTEAGRATQVAFGRSTVRGSAAATVRRAKLPRGARYVVTLRRGAKVLASTAVIAPGMRAPVGR